MISRAKARFVASVLLATVSCPSARSAPDPDLDPDLEAVRSLLVEAGVPAEIPDEEPAVGRDGADHELEGLWRMGWLDEGGVGRDGRVRWSYRAQSAVLRYRTREDDPGSRAGFARLDAGALRVTGGGVGYQAGFGLLAAAPGRSASVSAGSSLLPGRDRVVGWSGLPGARALTGAVAEMRWRGWAVTTGGGTDADRAATSLAGLAWESGASRIGVLVTSTGDSRGASLRTRLAGAGMEAAVEGALRRDGSRGRGAALATAWRWTIDRSLAVEAAVAAADGNPEAGLGRRPAALGGWDGRGAALRVRTRTGVLGWRIALQAGSHRDDGAAPRLVRRNLLELAAITSGAADPVLTLRLRRTEERRFEWSEAYPWLPAAEAARRSRSFASIRLAAGDARRWSVGCRTLVDRSHELTRTRSLLDASVATAVPGGRLRTWWGWAWGGDADLVSAHAPWSGLVVARHWGRWREETGFGLELGTGAVRLRTSAARRVPATPGERARFEIRCEAMLVR